MGVRKLDDVKGVEVRKEGDHRFSSRERLKKRKDIDTVFSSRAKFSCRGATIRVRENGLGYNRIAFVPVRKYGTAVERNRAKRLGRESFRLLRPELRQGFDFALILFPGCDTLAERSAQLRSLCETARLLGGSA